MLETVDLKASVPKAEFKSLWAELEVRLGQLQRDARAAGIPVLIVLEGWDAAGKGRVLNAIMQALDPRGFEVYHMDPATSDEQRYPVMRRYWLRLPANGQVVVFDLSWYQEVIAAAVEHPSESRHSDRAYERIRSFEQQLTEDGTVILKFFFHISQEEQTKRFVKLRKKKETAWKVGDPERRRNQRYMEFIEPTEAILRKTSTGFAPWTLVPATDRRFATLKVAETIVATLENALRRSREDSISGAVTTPVRRTSALNSVDMAASLSREAYDAALDPLQELARALQHRCYELRRSVVMVFEGWDAAGKGGAIRRLTKDLDPRGYTVIPVAAPDGIERRHHYLWRFWKAVPGAGHWTVFDRSWYGRVLVERVEGFCSATDWQRAYQEINEFEEQLIESGTPVFKFWMHVSPEVQLERLQEREATPHKHWKVTEEDWRNREKWDGYWAAASEMIERTSTPWAPWTIIAGNDKLHARVEVLKTVTEGLGEALA